MKASSFMIRMRMMNVETPKTVRIGPYIYRISSDAAEWKKHVAKIRKENPEDHEEACGYTVNLRQLILLDPDQEKDMLADTLLHEILHALYYTSGLGEIESPTEEQIVFIYSPHLLALLRNNPEILQFMLENRQTWDLSVP